MPVARVVGRGSCCDGFFLRIAIPVLSRSTGGASMWIRVTFVLSTFLLTRYNDADAISCSSSYMALMIYDASLIAFGISGKK